MFHFIQITNTGGSTMYGTLIAIEGIDGSGKSTLVQFLEDELRKEGFCVTKVMTCEKDKADVYKSVMKAYDISIHSPAAMFFYQMLHAHKADRAKRALEEGKIVIADRWDFSFFVSHENFGFFRTESPQLREDVSRLAFGDLKPEIGIYLDVSVDNALERRMWRKDIIKDLEAEKKHYEKVTRSYLRLAKRHKWEIVDANGCFEEVWKAIWELVMKKIVK